MKSFNNILVIAQDVYSNEVVLEKALQVAKRAHADLTVIANRNDQEIESHLERLYQQFLTDSYQRFQAPLDKPRLEINIKYHKAPFSHRTILAEISEHNYDLLVKDINSVCMHWWLSWSDNQYLLREPDTNLLLVGNTKWPERGHILAAIETEEATEKHRQLNQFMLDESQYLASLLDSDMHVINCYQEQPSISLATPLLNGNAIEPSQEHWQHLQETVHDVGLTQEHTHLEQGLPEFVIPNAVEKYHINIVALGAGEHNGVLSMLKGHSSEYIVDTLTCDALILKANMRDQH
ncbi:Nucleotide-binding universal stress protein, UspA family [Colwellia chukchiensis]|uniref:Nucleotide-binding universal stress protein, UspA family n=1 Tax=Colwellia chukchiensis TaxID=641665 RepID=A0A1H7S4W1_9GAMM|nr:universal stress protein [Colwellia chukchiensis]SEL67660.1 Nucleotide-binding universal stress protein, UspA family [Colwellia chukchiensis]